MINHMRFDVFVRYGSIEDATDEQALERMEEETELYLVGVRRRLTHSCCRCSFADWGEWLWNIVENVRAEHPLINTIWPSHRDLILLTRVERAVLLYLQLLFAMALCAVFYGKLPAHSGQVMVTAFINIVLLVPVDYIVPSMFIRAAALSSNLPDLKNKRNDKRRKDTKMRKEVRQIRKELRALDGYGKFFAQARARAASNTLLRTSTRRGNPNADLNLRPDQLATYGDARQLIGRYVFMKGGAQMRAAGNTQFGRIVEIDDKDPNKAMNVIVAQGLDSFDWMDIDEARKKLLPIDSIRGDVSKFPGPTSAEVTAWQTWAASNADTIENLIDDSDSDDGGDIDMLTIPGTKKMARPLSILSPSATTAASTDRHGHKQRIFVRVVTQAKVASGNDQAAILIQKIFRGHLGRFKAELALEIVNYTRPGFMEARIMWYRRGLRGVVYTLVALMLTFALYLNLIFGIKFDDTQQIGWIKGFLISLVYDLGLGIPIQIFLLMTMPGEFLHAIWYFVLLVLVIYGINGLAGTQVVDITWFEGYMKWILIYMFGF